MNENLNLEQFLAAQSAQGDSAGAGEFSIDLLGAQGRLRGLENKPGLYLLKFVQAAVAAGSTSVTITLGRREVTFSAQGPLFTLDEIQQALRGPFITHSRPAVAHLAWAFLMAPHWKGLEIHCGDDVF